MGNRLSKLRAQAALTLVEVTTVMAVLSVVVGTLLAGTSALQRGFKASEEFARAHAAQVRVCDYLQRDARAALDAKIEEGGAKVTFKLPQGDAGLVNLQLPASVLELLGAGSAAPAVTHVTYRFQNGEVSRATSGERRIIADGLSSFRVEEAGSALKITVAFASGYGRRGTAQTTATIMRATAKLRGAGLL